MSSDFKFKNRSEIVAVRNEREILSVSYDDELRRVEVKYDGASMTMSTEVAMAMSVCIARAVAASGGVQ